MSTRCNVVVKDGPDKLIFYRHSDGYPAGVARTLREFLKLVAAGNIRDDLEQAAGWLIVLGHEEYIAMMPEHYGARLMRGKPGMMSWKVGAYEPAIGIHGDIEFLYEIDLAAKSLRGWEHNGTRKGREVTDQLVPETA